MTVMYPFGYGKNGGPGAPATLDTIHKSTSWQLMDLEVQRRTDAVMIASGGRVGFGQGWRSDEQADAVFRVRHHVVAEYVTGAIWFEGKWWVLSKGYEPSAPADRSYHCKTINGRSVAVDYVGDMVWLDSHAAQYGVLMGVSGEAWHGQPMELPRSRSTYNAAPAKYPLHAWPLPGGPNTPIPDLPQEDDDMAKVVKAYDGPAQDLLPGGKVNVALIDTASIALTGGIASWIGNFAALQTQQVIGTIPDGEPQPVPRAALKAYRRFGPMPPVGYGYTGHNGGGTVAGDFADD